MLSSLYLNQKSYQTRVMRDPRMPLSRITLLCGPNGSGKSTVLDALREFILKPGVEWTRETAPALVEGACKALCFISAEKDNPRLFAKRDNRGGQTHSELLTGDDLAFMMLAKEKSHGQSNYDMLQLFMRGTEFDVLVLDEPENALDVEGLLWLREALQSSTKQFLIATHSPLLLSLALTTQEASWVNFGPAEQGHHAQRILDVYKAAVLGENPGGPNERLPREDFVPTRKKSKWPSEHPARKRVTRKDSA